MNWNEWFVYDESSASCLRWKVDIRTGKDGRVLLVSAGDVAGCLDADGYYRGQCCGKSWKAHRVVWELHNGDIKASVPIDHDNGVRHDNRISNLKLSTAKANSQNVAMSTRNTSGTVGVSATHQINKQGNRYDYWTAYWVEGSKLKSKSYSILKLGSVEARRLAEEYRANKITELNQAGESYSLRHGRKE